MKVGILSDTHGVLREEVVRHLEGCQMILHAGDIGNATIIEQLQQIAPVVAVRGNNDKGEWGEALAPFVRGVIDGIHYLNPGSCGRRRFSLPLTMVIGYVEKGKTYFQKIDL